MFSYLPARKLPATVSRMLVRKYKIPGLGTKDGLFLTAISVDRVSAFWYPISELSFLQGDVRRTR